MKPVLSNIVWFGPAAPRRVARLDTMATNLAQPPARRW
jgi:hypothetical protein